MFQVDRTSRLDDDKIEKAIAGYSDIEIAKFIIFCLRELFSKSMFQIYTKVEELKFKDFRRDKGFGLSMYLDCQEKNRMLILTKKQIDRPMPISFVPLAFCMPTSEKVILLKIL